MAILDPNVKGKGSIEYGLDVQRGLVEDVGVVHVFGRNPDINAVNGFEDIWGLGGEYTGYNATEAQQLSIVSTSVDDISVTGTGARTVEIRGLDANYNEIDEILNLNGTTPVITVNSYIRCATARVLTAGVAGSNLGNITGRQSITTSNIFFYVLIGDNNSLSCVYTTPSNKVAYVTGAFATLSRKQATSVEVKISVRYPNSVFQTVYWFSLVSAGGSYVSRDFTTPLVGIPTGSDIKIEADSSANDVGVSAGLSILTVDI